MIFVVRSVARAFLSTKSVTDDDGFRSAMMIRPDGLILTQRKGGRARPRAMRSIEGGGGNINLFAITTFVRTS